MDQNTTLLNQLNSLLGYKNVSYYSVEHYNSRTVVNIELFSKQKKHRSPAKVKRDQERQSAHVKRKAHSEKIELCFAAKQVVELKAKVEELESKVKRSYTSEQYSDVQSKWYECRHEWNRAEKRYDKMVKDYWEAERKSDKLEEELEAAEDKLKKSDALVVQLQEQLDVIRSVFDGGKKQKKEKKKKFEPGDRVIVYDCDLEEYEKIPYIVKKKEFKEDGMDYYTVQSLDRTVKIKGHRFLKTISTDPGSGYEQFAGAYAPRSSVFVKDKTPGKKKRRKQYGSLPDEYEDDIYRIKNITKADPSGITYRLLSLTTMEQKDVHHDDLFLHKEGDFEYPEFKSALAK